MVRFTRTLTQQHKIADENHREYKFSYENEEMDYYQCIDAPKKYFFIIELNEVRFPWHPYHKFSHISQNLRVVLRDERNKIFIDLTPVMKFIKTSVFHSSKSIYASWHTIQFTETKSKTQLHKGTSSPMPIESIDPWIFSCFLVDCNRSCIHKQVPLINSLLFSLFLFAVWQGSLLMKHQPENKNRYTISTKTSVQQWHQSTKEWRWLIFEWTL